MNDSQFKQQVLDRTLPAELFDHKGHLRLAFILIRESSSTAVERVSEYIRLYAESLGAKDKFHATITGALVEILASRMSVQPDLDFESFLKRNPDLLMNALDLLGQHYSETFLNSPKAKQNYIQPDIKPLF